MAVARAKVTGDKGLLAILTQLPGRVATRVNRRAVNLATTPILRASKAEAPVDKGNLRAALIKKVVSRKMRASGIVGADAAYVGGNGEQPVRYDHLVEYGHVTADGTVTTPDPFLQRGWDESIGGATDLYRQTMAEGIEAEAKNLGGT